MSCARTKSTAIIKNVIGKAHKIDLVQRLKSIKSILLNALNYPMDKQKILDMVNEFRQRFRAFLQTACVEIKRRYNFSNPVLSFLKNFNPKHVLDKNMRKPDYLFPIAELLPRCVANNTSVQLIDDEWRHLSSYHFPTTYLTHSEVDIFW